MDWTKLSALRGAMTVGALHGDPPTVTRIAKRAIKLALLFSAGLALGEAAAKPSPPGVFTSEARLDALAKKVGAKSTPLVNPGALAPAKRRLAAGEGLRVLQLGDSHIAADYISSMARHRLQAKFGDGGRGFTHIDQRWGFGGRKLKRPERPWAKDRIVDPHRAGRRFGFSGLSLTSKRKGASIKYQLLPGDERVVLYYEPQKRGGKLALKLGGKRIALLDTAADKSGRFVVELPKDRPRKKKRPGAELTLFTLGPQVRLYGISFEKRAPGLIWESIGPVGADAKVYLQLNQDSLAAQLKAHHPDLIVLMVGGNDALKIRKRWTTLDKVRADHVQLLARMKELLPDSTCLVMTPMDAGRRRGGKIRSKAKLTEVAAMQREVAEAAGCALWDTMGAMGGPGSVARWAKARVMNKDLVHPKKASADLLGRLLAEALEPAL